MTLAGFRATAGVADSPYACVVGRDNLQRFSWRASIAGRAGHWWCVVTLADAVVSAGWSAGTARDRDLDMERAMARTNNKETS